MASETCLICRAPLEPSRGFSFCAKCGAPRFCGDAWSPFDVFGIAPSFMLDEKDLDDRYYALSKRLHPDRFAAAGTAARLKSQELAAALNQAFLALRQPENRLEALLKRAGALSERSATQNQIPTDLAEEYFELQEAIAEDPSRAAALARGLRAKLESLRQKMTENLHAAAEKTNWSTPAPSDIETIVDLRHRRSYIRAMIENIVRLGV